MDIKENNNSNNCLWLINAMKQYNSESDISLYNWKRYNSKDDFNVIIKSFNVEEKTEFQSIIDRKGSVVTHDISVKLNKKVLPKKDEVKNNITYLDILYKNDNVLIKYAVYPDNKIVAEKYADKIKIEESEQQEYYFNNCLVTYLTNIKYFINQDATMETEMYVESEEMIDDNTALITIVQEDNREYNGYDAVTEYVLKKYQNVNGKIIPYEK